MIVSSLLFMAATLDMAVMNYYAIRGLTDTAIWHVCQYIFIALLLGSGYAYPKQELTWHTFGEASGVIGVGIAVYVFTLHYLLRR